MPREHVGHWGVEKEPVVELSSEAKAVGEALEKRGASFFHELTRKHESACRATSSAGSPSSPAPASRPPTASRGLRALLAPQEKRKALVETAGRWSLLERRTQ